MDYRPRRAMSPGGRRIARGGSSSTGMLIFPSAYDQYSGPSRSSTGFTSAPRTSVERLGGSRVVPRYRHESPPRQPSRDDHVIRPRRQTLGVPGPAPARPLSYIPPSSPSRARPIITSALEKPPSPSAVATRPRRDEDYYIQPSSSSRRETGRNYTYESNRPARDSWEHGVYRRPGAVTGAYKIDPPYVRPHGPDERNLGYEYTNRREQVYRDTAPRLRTRRESDTSHRERPFSVAGLENYPPRINPSGRDSGPPITRETRGFRSGERTGLERSGSLTHSHRKPDNELPRDYMRDEHDISEPRKSSRVAVVHQDHPDNYPVHRREVRDTTEVQPRKHGVPSVPEPRKEIDRTEHYDEQYGRTADNRSTRYHDQKHHRGHELEHREHHRGHEQEDRDYRTREDRAREDRTREDRAREDRTREDRAREDRTREDRTREDRTREDRTREDRTREDRTREDRTREDRTREDRTREDRMREDRTREDGRARGQESGQEISENGLIALAAASAASASVPADSSRSRHDRHDHHDHHDHHGRHDRHDHHKDDSDATKGRARKDDRGHRTRREDSQTGSSSAMTESSDDEKRERHERQRRHPAPREDKELEVRGEAESVAASVENAGDEPPRENPASNELPRIAEPSRSKDRHHHHHAHTQEKDSYSEDSTSSEARESRDSRDSREKKKRQVRVVTPSEDSREPEPQIKGILRPPREKFPEDPAPVREGVAPLNKKGIPPNARWTKIDRKLVNPEALAAGNERFEERPEYVIVLRVLTKEDIEAYALKTQEIRAKRGVPPKVHESR